MPMTTRLINEQLDLIRDNQHATARREKLTKDFRFHNRSYRQPNFKLKI